MRFGRTSAFSISWKTSSARAHSPPSVNALMSVEYATTSGLTPAATICPNSRSADCHCPAFPHALIAAE